MANPAPAAGGHPADRPPRRRQARGERRAQQLLDAADAVFARSGYAATSTNAIAREAGVSPGTLYQFFPNKAALAVELGRRYNRALQEKHSAAFTPANVALPLAAMLDAAVDPVIDFCTANPGFAVLLQSTDAPDLVAEEREPVHAAAVAAVEDMLTHRAPELSPAEVSLSATMSLGIFKGGLELYMTADAAERKAYRKEIKRALFGYLAPIVGTAAVPRGD
ncbi:TetR/AcrR family transcriptional regulator [Streptomyces sp. WMMC500]|uniref:TetR/AcrR family transcriptional regulator n=1 Tax=Streptomyces sp. WMMC500 TaxID=3015154 RepID=UPI00248B8597|nr:TetR/AcrR family transcriptional regulator [Streptomyces sp. WMMC500]WBB59219.1 TetR/AcrR family transcriptional regulator [Streptomyces sp. WMMC500]